MRRSSGSAQTKHTLLRVRTESKVYPLCAGLSFFKSSRHAHWSMAEQTVVERVRSVTLSLLGIPSKIEMSSVRVIDPEQSISTMSSLFGTLLSGQRPQSATTTVSCASIRDIPWVLVITPRTMLLLSVGSPWSLPLSSSVWGEAQSRDWTTLPNIVMSS